MELEGLAILNVKLERMDWKSQVHEGEEHIS